MRRRQIALQQVPQRAIAQLLGRAGVLPGPSVIAFQGQDTAQACTRARCGVTSGSSSIARRKWATAACTVAFEVRQGTQREVGACIASVLLQNRLLLSNGLFDIVIEGRLNYFLAPERHCERPEFDA